MTSPRVRLTPAPDFGALRDSLGVPTAFPVPVLEEAAAAAAAPTLPAYDATALPFATIDPPGSTDLDQALAIEPRGSGWRVWYAIADVAAFVRPGGAVDAEAHRRGETLYSPDLRTPLHPPAFSEAAASLLPDGDRPALLWRLDLDDAGAVVETEVRRALIRSRAQLTYRDVDRDPSLAPHLEAVGRLRQEQEVARGGVSLRLPDEEVVSRDGHWGLELRAPLPAEDWNSQLSLLTGMAAATIMLDGGVGLLRTLPPPDPGALAALARSAAALGVPWSPSYPDAVRSLDPTHPKEAALLALAARTLRGAGYAAFDQVPPGQAEHAAIAASYAHATAPLRRLADRYVGEVCLALCAGEPVPTWARSALPALPAEMAASGQRAHALDRAVVDLVEATLLSQRVGDVFDAVAVDAHSVQLGEPPVKARCDGNLPLGEAVRVRLVVADPDKRDVRFTLA